MLNNPSDRTYSAEKIARYVSSDPDEVRRVLDEFPEGKAPDGNYNFKALRHVAKLSLAGRDTPLIRVRFNRENKVYAVEAPPEEVVLDGKRRYEIEVDTPDGKRRGRLLAVKNPLPDILPEAVMYECAEISITDPIVPGTTMIYTKTLVDEYSELLGELTEQELVDEARALISKSQAPIDPEASLTKLFRRATNPGDLDQSKGDELMGKQPDISGLDTLSDEEIDKMVREIGSDETKDSYKRPK